MPNYSGHLNILKYIINKSFFTLLSITMKWINLWITVMTVKVFSIFFTPGQNRGAHAPMPPPPPGSATGVVSETHLNHLDCKF